MGNMSTILRPEVLSDLMETTSFSADQIRNYYRSFRKQCSEARMSLDVSQFEQIYSELFPEGNASQFARHVFRTFDRDHNGRIDFREFLMSISIHQKGTDEEKLQWLFNMFDLDGTGFISHDELVELIAALRKLDSSSSSSEKLASPDEMATMILDLADKNKDNQLSAKEFKEGVQEIQVLRDMLRRTSTALTATAQRAPPSSK